MKRLVPLLGIFVFSLLLGAPCLSAAVAQPVTPDATPEARALLQFLYDISGQHTLTGQHNYPNVKDRNSQFVETYLGKTPAVFSTDFGHAKAGDSDSYLARPDIVKECIRQHQLGSLITICWHAVPPTAEEPVTFRPLPGADPKALKSVSGKLLDEQFRDVLTPGTPLYERWCAQVDAIAIYLKQLQDAHVPVLWRPYHEMNGDWFWWGGRAGDTAALYRQIFDRLTNHHQLKNLVWVWSMDRVSRPGMEHEKYFPGIEYVDVLGLDVYSNDFAQSYYESLEKLSQGKPLTLAEVGNPPSLEILSKQPKWTFFVTWAGMVRNTPKKTYQALFNDPRYVSRNDPVYAKLTASYRQSCGLAALEVKPATPNFSGTWVLNEERSEFGRMGAAFAPARLDIAQQENALTIRSTRVVEFADDEVTEQKLALDGTESQSEVMRTPRTTTAQFSDDRRQLILKSHMSPPWAGGAKITSEETWTLEPGGQALSIRQTTTSRQGPTTNTLVFEKR